MNVLVTGANGQLGQTIKEIYSRNSQGLKFTFVSKAELDITNPIEIDRLFRATHFNYCINCAAYTNVDGAEDNQKEAYKINGDAVGLLAGVCKKNETKLIHISTDYVFNGKGTEPYTERSKTDPINTYGASKLMGEEAIIENLKEYFIVRTSWLYSHYGHNFVRTITKKIKDNSELQIVTSQVGSPTSCIDLTEFIFAIIASRTKAYGIYHYCSLGETTWYGLAKQIASHFKDYDQSKLKPIKFYPTKATRPEYSVMNSSKASHIGTLQNWQKSVDRVVKLLIK